MKKRGFTLIEIVVVIAVVALVVPAIVAILLGILREQTKIYRLSTVKKEGDNILTVMNTNIRNNALTIHSSSPPDETNIVCQNIELSDPSSSLFFQNIEGNWFGFSASASAVTSTSAGLALNLNSNKTAISNLIFTCIRNAAYSPALVSVSFDICYAQSPGICAAGRGEETASLHYQTRIKLRNF